MMHFKRAAVCVAFIANLWVCAAHADVIDFNLPSGVALVGSSYSQDGFTFTNSFNIPEAYGNWIAWGFPQYNADGSSADIFQNYPNTINTITAQGSQPFGFQSIALAPVYNNGTGGSVLFTFNYAGGSSSIQTVTMASGLLGLQTFSFNQTNLENVEFEGITTQGTYLQFDNVGVNGNGGSVPEPFTLSLFGAGLAGLASAVAVRRRKAKA